ncbi:type IV fimbrial biogenesis protein FimT [Marinobacter persicus]|uniref:Type II secretion system protein H n=1 Tax=Marinobacter persicus TaxID=930118 RepID=A0A1I3X329_9GAMM|nr:GspH/FimT family pseudopilin [Marinobacter persicus]SFK13960.1 type IV fimbrial biogenesis protein FimT [Marinobacter persicus]
MKSAKMLAGFTLVELITTIAVLMIVSSIAYQGWNAWIERHRHQTILQEYNTLFSFARWSAASKRSLVTVCPLSDQGICVDDWKRPVSVFIDRNNDKTPDSGEILRQLDAIQKPYHIISRTAGRGYFQFNERGFAHGSLGSLVLCPDSHTNGVMSYMAVNMAGRFRIQSDEDRDRSIKLSWGATVEC